MQTAYNNFGFVSALFHKKKHDKYNFPTSTSDLCNKSSSCALKDNPQLSNISSYKDYASNTQCHQLFAAVLVLSVGVYGGLEMVLSKIVYSCLSLQQFQYHFLGESLGGAAMQGAFVTEPFLLHNPSSMKSMPAFIIEHHTQFIQPVV